jgi:Bifunctional DNA primase/polymerase, N-terminal
MTVLSDAIGLAEKGFAVFPCLPSKAPATPRGFHDASNDQDVIRILWQRWPGPLIGTPTGRVNSFDVLDIDPRHGGDAWHATHRNRLPQTRVHQTRSGGLHILFLHHDGVRNSAGKIAPGIDVRGQGGFVIWWPTAGCSVAAPGAPAAWPDWLLPLILPPPPPPPPPRAAVRSVCYGSVHPLIVTAITTILTRLEMAAAGQKHDRLRAAAVTIGGLLDEAGITTADAEQTLLEAVRRAGGAEVIESNARKTIAWGLDRGRRSPLRLGTVDAGRSCSA